MRLMRALACCGALLLSGGALGAQAGTGRVTGVVTQAGAAGGPISDVAVSVVGTGIGTLTNADGRYTLVNVPVGRQKVQFRRIGYALQEDSVTVTAGSAVLANAELRVVAVTLQQQVVVGYGTQRRSDITGAVSSVQPNTDQVPAVSLEQLLQGTAAGVQVTQASTAPGGGISIRIRGGSSVTGGNEPLYVIDGFPIENDIEGSSPGNGGRANTVPFNPLNSLNPSDIESIEILKDASATAIYGARGANGVVLVTTRRGLAGQKPRVTVDMYTGMQSVAKRYDLLNASQFAQFANTWWSTQSNYDSTAIFSDAQIAAMGKGTDWQDLIFQSAPVRNIQVGVTGGSSGANATKYAVSTGLFDQDGVVVGSAFRRVSLRGSIDQNVGERFRISSNLQLAHTGTTAVPTDGGSNANAGAVGAALQYYPFMPVYKADGSTYTILNEDAPTTLNPSLAPNPVSLVRDVTDKLADSRVLANLFGEFTIVSGLKLRISGGADYAARTRDTYYPRTTLTGRAVNGQARVGRTDNLSLLNENTLTYDKTLGDIHRINAVAGYTRQRQNSDRENLINEQFVSDITTFEDLGAGARANGPSVSTGATQWTMVSYLGRVNYTLLDRYLFTGTIRRDGSSRFGEGNKWGVFPSLAVGWRLTEEPLFKQLPFSDKVSDLKFRFSWGEAGNPTIRPYQSTTRLAAQSYPFGNGSGQTGYYPLSLGNPELGWETTEQRDLGMDAGFWDNRIEVTGDIYMKRTFNLLLARALPPDVGFGSVLVNVGGVRNRGRELAVRLNIINGEAAKGAFRWTTGVNYAMNKNWVESLGGDTELQAARAADDLSLNGTITRVGEPLGVFYGYKTAGILRDSAAAANYTKMVKPLSGTSWKPGDLAIADVSGDSVITSADRTIIGNPAPKYTIGWTNNVGWKRFELSTTLDGAYGARLLNLNLARLESGSPRTNMLADVWTDRWTPQNPNAKYPRIGGAQLFIGSDITSDMLEDGSYTRLRAVTLTYNVPPAWLGRTGLGMARIYVTGTNLATWTNYSGFNPDVSSISIGNVNRGIDVGSYPLAKAVTFGLNLSY